MKIVILDAGTLGDDIDLSVFSELGETVIYATSAPDEVEERISDCDVAVLNKVKLSEKELSKATNLKLICITATGFDNVNKEACKKYGIALCNVVGYSTQSVAQITVTLALALISHLSYYDRYVKSGAYTRSGKQNCLEPVFPELEGKTWGIAGYGNIGQQVAKIARAFGCKVIAYSRTPKENVENVSLETLCRESDILSIHLPLNNESNQMFGKEQFQWMKKNAVLINVARGAVIDDEALTEAILNHEIGAFGSDVYATEPIPENHPFSQLFSMENVLFTPHLAWGAYEARVRCMNEVMENIRSFYSGGKKNRIV